jgi:hypothetical protein
MWHYNPFQHFLQIIFHTAMPGPNGTRILPSQQHISPFRKTKFGGEYQEFKMG